MSLNISKNSVHYERVHTLHGYPILINTFREPVEHFEIIHNHWHRSIEIAYRTNTTGTLFLNNREIPLQNMQITLINSGEPHEFHIHPTPSRHTILVILPYEFLLQIVPNIDQYYFEIDPFDVVLREHLLQLENLNDHPSEYSTLKIYGLAYQMIAYLMEHYAKKRISSIPNLYSKWEKDTLAYIEEHYANITSIDELSQHFGYSREYFSRIFKEHMGISCQEFLTSYRLDILLKQMEQNETNWEKLATDNGFKNRRNLFRAFSDRYGETPIQFMKHFQS